MRPAHQPQYRLNHRSRIALLKFRYRRLGIHWANFVDIATGLWHGLFAVSKQGRPLQFVTTANGGADDANGRWCFYAAYSRRSIVSEMVLTQLRVYRDAGFSVVFITMSERIEDGDLEKLTGLCSHIIRRQSFGRDFGAWAHAAAFLKNELRSAQALLLTDDSNLGPIFDLSPWIGACMARDGLFGLTESVQRGSHLQSYFLLANGPAAVASALELLTSLKLSRSKWLMIQRGEIAFTQAMKDKDHFVAAVLDHETMEDALLRHPLMQSELRVVYPEVFNGVLPISPEMDEATRQRTERFNRYALRANLFRRPLNPSHQFNSLLLDHFRFPFVKVELVVKNPALMPSAPDWRYAIAKDSPVTEEMLDAHLGAL